MGKYFARHLRSRQPQAATDRDVNPTFNWVRLAQRVPVRIHIDHVPEESCWQRELLARWW